MTFHIPPYQCHPLAVEYPTPPERIPYGVRMIGADLEWRETQGEGIRVVVLDSGCPDHKDIKLASQVTFTTEPAIDKRGHGTHVAGIIAANGGADGKGILGVAPGVDLFCGNVADGTGSIPDEAVIEGLKWSISVNADVVCMSFGSPVEPPRAVHDAIREAYDKGIVLVAAAGNEGAAGCLWPARYPEVIGVAAVDMNRLWASFSSMGADVDLAAAGVQVWSCWCDGGYMLLSGTSMAAPHIVGAVAILQAKARQRFGAKFAPEMVRVLLETYAEDMGEPGPDSRYGCGVFSFGRLGSSDSVHTVELTIGSRDYAVDGQPKKMDVAPFVQSGRTWVPARFVAEGLGATVTPHAGRNGQVERVVIRG